MEFAADAARVMETNAAEVAKVARSNDGRMGAPYLMNESFTNTSPDGADSFHEFGAALG